MRSVAAWASRGKSFGLRKWGFALRLPRQHRERFHFVLAAVAAVATVVGAAAVAVVVAAVAVVVVRRRRRTTSSSPRRLQTPGH